MMAMLQRPLTFTEKRDILKQHSPQFMRMPGVISVGVVTRAQGLVFEVTVNDLSVAEKLSGLKLVDGLPVQFELGRKNIAAQSSPASC
jgi:hypothetical protein